MADETAPTIEEMRQLVADADRASSEAGLVLLDETTASDEWKKIKNNAIELQKAYQHDAMARIQLDGLITVMNGVEGLPTQIRQRL